MLSSFASPLGSGSKVEDKIEQTKPQVKLYPLSGSIDIDDFKNLTYEKYLEDYKLRQEGKIKSILEIPKEKVVI